MALATLWCGTCSVRSQHVFKVLPELGILRTNFLTKIMAFFQPHYLWFASRNLTSTFYIHCFTEESPKRPRGHARHGLGFLGSSLLWHLRWPGRFLIWVKLIKHGRVCDYRMAVGASIGEGVTFSQKTTGGFKVFRSHPRDCCRLLKSKIKLVKTFYLLSLTLLQPHMWWAQNETIPHLLDQQFGTSSPVKIFNKQRIVR